MKKIYDAAIIGAGPGGARAAIECSANGLTTIILEKKANVGMPVHCGECLSSFATDNTGLSLPDHVISSRVKGIRVIFPDNSEKKIYENGYVLEKNRFEQWMVETACKNGAELRLNTKVTGMSYNENRWRIQTASGTGIDTRVLIDASGVHSISNTLLHLNKPYATTTGVQYKLEGVRTDNFINFYLWPNLAQEGYLWIIPKNNNTCNVGLVSTNPVKIKQRLDKFIKTKELEANRIGKIFGGKLPASGPLKQTFSNGLLIIGDAAGFTSPFFEGGTHLALKSGCMAAKIAIDAVKSKNYSIEKLSRYQKQWEKIFPDYRKILKGRHSYFNFSDADLNLLAQYIPEDIKKVTKYKKGLSLLRLILKNPGLLRRGSIPLIRAFESSRAKDYGW